MKRTTINEVMPLNWHNLVSAAVKKRKELGLKQKEHAALAEVCLNTLINFEKGRTNLSLDKVFAILNVIGMLDSKTHDNNLTKFAEESYSYWNNLTKDLEHRHKAGFVSYAVKLNGDIKKFDSDVFADVVSKLTKTNIIESDINKVVCWNGYRQDARGSPERDFWVIDRDGLLYLQKAYKDDDELLNRGKIFDLNRPILDTVKLVALITCFAEAFIELTNKPCKIELEITYTKLQNRVLVNTLEAIKPMATNKKSKLDIIKLSALFHLDEIKKSLYPRNYKISQFVFMLLRNLYSNFEHNLEFEHVLYLVESYFPKNIQHI